MTPLEVAAPWWKGAALYQVYPRSFADSDGDGVGDLPGIIDRLDHIASLNVDGVWLSPFFPSPQADFGYDVSDFTDVDPLFGTLADFDRLLDRAHALGLRVVIDQVYGHTADRHPWFLQSRAGRAGPRADWYVWADPRPDGTPPNNWQSVFHGPAWTWAAERRQYYFHNFLPEQPALDLHEPAVVEAILGVARFWLERGVDGFRLDALNFALHDPRLRDNPVAPPGARTRPADYQLPVFNRSRPEAVGFVERIAAAVADYPDRFTVAEVGGADPTPEMKAFTAAGRLDTAYGFTFLYADRLTPELVRDAMADWPQGPDDPWPSWAFSNHDAPRAVSRWAEGRDEGAVARCALALLACLRGNIFLYQGEELGLPQADVPRDRLRDPEAIRNWPLTLGRDGARTPMPWAADQPHAGFSSAEPWLPVDPRHQPLAVNRQDPADGSTLEVARTLLGLRRRREPLRLGSLRFDPAPDGVLAFTRSHQDETIACAFNLQAGPIGWRAAGPVLAAVNGAAPDRLPPLGALVTG